MWFRSRLGLLLLLACIVWSATLCCADSGSIPASGVLSSSELHTPRVHSGGVEANALGQRTASEWSEQSVMVEPDGARRRLLATLRQQERAPASPAPASSSSSSSRPKPSPPNNRPARPNQGRDADVEVSPIAASCTFYAPIIDSVRAGDGSLVVTILPPPNLAPSCQPVVGYSLRAVTENFVKVVGSTALDAQRVCVITVTGLTNGVSYNLSARASDGQSTSQLSAVVPATPATVPGAPTITSSKAGDQSIVLSFDAPSSNGGAEITGYEVTDALGSEASTSGPSSPLLLTGLVNGQNYQLVVTALNARGTGPPSERSPVLMPQPVPRRPFVFAVQSGISRKLLLYFFDIVPSSGGLGVGTADYFRATARSSDMLVTAQSLPSTTQDSAAQQPQQQSPMELVGLTDGEWYNVSVSGINEAGEGMASWPLAVQVGATAQSYSYFYADRQYTGGLCLPGAAARSQQVPPISWEAMAQVHLGSLVDCSTLVVVITPPPDSSSTGPAGAASSGPGSAASVAPPPIDMGDNWSSTMESGSGSNDGGSSTGASSPLPDAAASSTGSAPFDPLAEDSTGAIASVPSDARPRSGAVRLEIHMLWNNTSVLTARASFWRGVVAQWAEMLKIDPARLIVVAVQPVMVNRAQQPTPRGRSANTRRQQQHRDAAQQEPQEISQSRNLASKADVTLVIDVLPPLRTDDAVSSAGFAGNLTSALQDPESSVAMSLASSGASVTQISSVEGLLPPPEPEDSSDGLDTHSRLFIVGLSVGLACVAAMAVALGVMMWRGKRLHRSAAVPKSPPPVINGGSGAKATATAVTAAAAANNSKRPQSPYSVPVRGFDDRRGGAQVRITSLRLEPAAAAASALPLHAQAHQDRAKSSSPFNHALALTHAHYPQPLLVPSSGAGAASALRGLPRRPASYRDHGYLEPYVLQDHADDDDGEKEEQYTLQMEDEPHCTPQPHTRHNSSAAAETGAPNGPGPGPLADQAHYVFHRAAALSTAESAAASSVAATAESEPSVLMHDSVSAPSLQLQQLQLHLQLQPAPRLAPTAVPASAAPAPLLHNFYEAAESELDPLFLAAFKPAVQLQQQQNQPQQPSASVSASADSSLNQQSRHTPFVDQSPPADFAATPAAADVAAAQSSTESHSSAALSASSASDSASSGSSAALIPPPAAHLAPQQSHGQPVSPLPPAALAAALPPSTPPAQPQLGRSIMLLQPFSFAAAAAAQPRAP